LVRAAESYGCLPTTKSITEVLREVAEANWECANGSPYRGEKVFAAFLQHVSQCQEAFDAMPIMEEDPRPVRTIAACHWYQAQRQDGGHIYVIRKSRKLVDAIIVAASYQLPCMEEECGIL
jgi:hypothetical protein